MPSSNRGTFIESHKRPGTGAAQARRPPTLQTFAGRGASSSKPLGVVVSPHTDVSGVVPCIIAHRSMPNVCSSPWRSLVPSRGSRRLLTWAVCRRGRALARVGDGDPASAALCSTPLLSLLSSGLGAGERCELGSEMEQSFMSGSGESQSGEAAWLLPASLNGLQAAVRWRTTFAGAAVRVIAEAGAHSF